MMNQETLERQAKKLESQLGAAISKLLANPQITELMMNPDGTLWTDDYEKGLQTTGLVFTPEYREAIIATVAGILEGVATKRQPIVEGELPFYKHRFHGVLPPLSKGPLFTIRKHNAQHLTIEDYVSQGVMTREQAERIYECLEKEENIIISGATKSGKTTLANAFLTAIAGRGVVRVVTLEDTPELQCAAANCVQLYTDGQFTLRDLVRTTLRLRPDRIIVGEVRGPEALDLFGAWNTGHRGGLSTIHANDTASVFLRAQMLVAYSREYQLTEALFAGAVNVLIHIELVGQVRRVTEMVRVVPDGQSFQLVPLT